MGDLVNFLMMREVTAQFSVPYVYACKKVNHPADYILMLRHRFLGSKCCAVFQSGICVAAEDNKCFYKNPKAHCRIALNSSVKKLPFSFVHSEIDEACTSLLHR